MMLMSFSRVVILTHPYHIITSLCAQIILHMSRNIQMQKQRSLYNVKYFIFMFSSMKVLNLFFYYQKSKEDTRPHFVPVKCTNHVISLEKSD